MTWTNDYLIRLRQDAKCCYLSFFGFMEEEVKGKGEEDH